MASLVPMNKLGALTRRDPGRLALFKRTVGKHLIPSEIDEAIEWCELFGANPWSGDIFFFCFDKDDAEKRRMVPVLGIKLYRKIAKRTDNYRPDDRPARFTYDDALKGPDNPAGILDCEVTVYLFSHGEWFPTTERLKWSERAPIMEGSEYEWVDDPSGAVQTEGKWKGRPKRIKQKKSGGNAGPMLDPKKTNWRTMPETMLAKCVEAACIRKAWPNETSGTYVEGELDRADILDLTATEIIDKEEVADRYARIGGANTLVVDWLDGKELDRVPPGQFYDRVTAWINVQEEAGYYSVVVMWATRNRRTMQEFWALEKDAALKIKKRVEDIEKKAKAMVETQ